MGLYCALSSSLVERWEEEKKKLVLVPPASAFVGSLPVAVGTAHFALSHFFF